MQNSNIEESQKLVLDIVESDKGSLLGRVELGHADFLAPRDETWWMAVRSGQLEPDLSQYKMQIRPGRQPDGSGRCEGFDVEIFRDGQRYQRHFSVESMSHVAQRKVLALVAQKVISPADVYKYYVRTVPGESHASNTAVTPAMQSKAAIEPLCFESAAMAEYMARSEPIVGNAEPPDTACEAASEIFVTEEVWSEGRKLAHRGGKNESAAVVSGRLFRDTESAEVFAVWDACLEAEAAVEEEYSVTFTGETWARIRELMEFRRRRINPHERICASVHRHPWLPEADAEGRRMCEACPTAKYCGRTTARPSAADFQWHRSVFVGQPWATLLIWGYNAREEEEFRLYGLENGCFQERAIRLLTD